MYGENTKTIAIPIYRVLPYRVISYHTGTKCKRRCGKYTRCNALDCGKCSNCKDMRRFGGPGLKKKACTHCTCQDHGISTGTVHTHVYVICITSYFQTHLGQNLVQRYTLSKLVKMVFYPRALRFDMWTFHYSIHEDIPAQILSAPSLRTSPTSSLSSFLASLGRKVFAIRGENCLFRSLSHQLLNTQDEHNFMRSTLVHFENLNQFVFTYLTPPVTAMTVTEHIHRMLRPNTWGTHMEVIAAAAFFRAPVYYTKSTQTGGYSWECREPLPISGL